jgi:hypothetical protein
LLSVEPWVCPYANRKIGRERKRGKKRYGGRGGEKKQLVIGYGCKL